MKTVNINITLMALNPYNKRHIEFLCWEKSYLQRDGNLLNDFMTEQKMIKPEKMQHVGKYKVVHVVRSKSCKRLTTVLPLNESMAGKCNSFDSAMKDEYKKEQSESFETHSWCRVLEQDTVSMFLWHQQ